MSEAYFLSASAAATPSQAVQTAFSAARARSTWVDEVYLLSGKEGPLSPQARDLQNTLPGVPLSVWANQTGLDGLILQFANRQLIAAERRLVLVVQQSRARSVAVLLTNPQAVGVYNLAPLSQIHPGWVLPASTQPCEAAAAALTTIQVEPARVNWLAGDPIPVGFAEVFPSARRVAHTPTGLFFQLLAAARSLKNTAPLALLIHGPMGQALRCFLLEAL